MTAREASERQLAPSASVIIRTFNSGRTVERAVASVREQDLPAEIVVVDSGSEDGTLDLVAEQADIVLSMPQSAFSYGGALNLGAQAATSGMHVALSSHCALPRHDWLRIAREHVDHGACAVVGLERDAHRHALSGPVAFGADYLLENRHWGLSNHASAWSADAWRAHRFDESLTASEDKEWTWRAVGDLGDLMVDPRLLVPGVHRRAEGVQAYYRRMVKEILATDAHLVLPPFGWRQAVADFAGPRPSDPFLSMSRRLGRTRAVEVAARWRAGQMSSGEGSAS